MRRFLIAVAVASFAALPLAQTAASQDAQDHFVVIPTADPELKAAIREARATLNDFWKAMAKPGPGENGFSLKVAITEGTKTENFWLINVERKGGKLAGTISNAPEWLKAVRQGQRYEFSEDRITDWTYLRNGRIVGNRTARALLKLLPQDEAERLRKTFEKP